MISLETVRLAFDVTPVPMMLADEGGHIRLANAEFHRLFGYAPGTMIDMSVDLLVPEALRAAHVDLRRAFSVLPAKRRMGAARDISGVMADGSPLPLDLALEPVSVEGVPMIIVSAIDLRERLAEKQRIRDILDAASSAMLVVNPGGRIVFVNSAVEALLGYPPKVLSGQPVEVLVPPEHRGVHQVYRRSFASLGGSRNMARGRTISAWHREGHPVRIEVALNPIILDGMPQVVVTLVDLSDRIAAEETLAARAHELERLNADLEQFSRSVSHDLKAPLSSIAGLLELCLEDLESGDHAGLEASLRRAHDIAARSIGDIEELLRQALTSEREMVMSRVSLEPLVRQIWQDLTGPDHGKTMQLDLDLDASAALETETATLRSILRNLLANAIRHRDRDKPVLLVRVGTRVDEGALKLTVSDNGSGIPASFLPEVFGLFKRRGESGGSGIGLNLAQRSARRLGGELTVTSIPGTGSEFTLALPITQPPETQPPETKPSETQPGDRPTATEHPIKEQAK